jgi:hypothetical protein
MAVRCCTFGYSRSVMSPGPGPSSRTFGPNSTPSKTHRTRCCTVFRHRKELHNQLCRRFTHAPYQCT